MFERMANGWELAKESWGVLKMDKELVVFPLLSGVACLLVLASFATPLFMTGYIDALSDDPEAFQSPVSWVIAFAFYFVNYFVIVFFNSALVASALIRFRGGDPTLSDGFGAAMNRLPQIAAWALVSATVGILLRAVEQAHEKAGSLISAILGTAWSIMTYFVVPVLVVEKVGPFEAVKRSVGVLKRTWGEALAANFGIGFIVFVAMLPAIAMLFGGAWVAASVNAAVGITIIACGVVSTRSCSPPCISTQPTETFLRISTHDCSARPSPRRHNTHQHIISICPDHTAWKSWQVCIRRLISRHSERTVFHARQSELRATALYNRPPIRQIVLPCLSVPSVVGRQQSHQRWKIGSNW